MRCKAGDLALIIEGEGTGMMVTCVALMQSRYVYTSLGPGMIANMSPAWEVDRDVPWFHQEIRVMARVALDRSLMPINPMNDEQDATPTVVNHEVSV